MMAQYFPPAVHLLHIVIFTAQHSTAQRCYLRACLPGLPFLRYTLARATFLW
jgi:hypothetical protein